MAGNADDDRADGPRQSLANPGVSGLIVFRYLSREVLVTMSAVSAVLLVIIASGRFIKYLAQAAQGLLDPGSLFLIMAFRIPRLPAADPAAWPVPRHPAGLRAALSGKRDDRALGDRHEPEAPARLYHGAGAAGGDPGGLAEPVPGAPGHQPVRPAAEQAGYPDRVRHPGPGPFPGNARRYPGDLYRGTVEGSRRTGRHLHLAEGPQ